MIAFLEKIDLQECRRERRKPHGSVSSADQSIPVSALGVKRLLHGVVHVGLIDRAMDGQALALDAIEVGVHIIGQDLFHLSIIERGA